MNAAGQQGHNGPLVPLKTVREKSKAAAREPGTAGERTLCGRRDEAAGLLPKPGPDVGVSGLLAFSPGKSEVERMTQGRGQDENTERKVRKQPWNCPSRVAQNAPVTCTSGNSFDSGHED